MGIARSLPCVVSMKKRFINIYNVKHVQGFNDIIYYINMLFSGYSKICTKVEM